MIQQTDSIGRPWRPWPWTVGRPWPALPPIRPVWPDISDELERLRALERRLAQEEERQRILDRLARRGVYPGWDPIPTFPYPMGSGVGLKPGGDVERVIRKIG